MVVAPVQFLALAALPIVQTSTAACAISGAGTATPGSAAVCALKVGPHTDEARAKCLNSTAHPAKKNCTPDFAIQSVELTIQGWVIFEYSIELIWS